MKVILFGGAESGEGIKEMKMIERVIKREKPKQVLHIPFARLTTREVEWQGDWYHRNIKHPGIAYLSAESKADMAKLSKPLIFISGGSSIMNLHAVLKKNPKLVRLIKNASCIIGESAGAKILGKHFRISASDPKSKMAKGLNVIKDTVIEAHYTQRKREKILELDMEEAPVLYGIGIDTVTAIEFATETFPNKIKKLGGGKVVIREQVR
jgi:cyanophycinase-like exopeptidase